MAQRRQVIHNGFWKISQDLDNGKIEISDGTAVVDSFSSPVLSFDALGDLLVTYRAKYYINMKAEADK